MGNRAISELNLEIGNIVSAGIEIQTVGCTATNFRLKLVFFNSGGGVISSKLGTVAAELDSISSSGSWYRSVANKIEIPANTFSINIGYVYDTVSVANQTVSSRKPTINRGHKISQYVNPANNVTTGGAGGTPHYDTHEGLRSRVIDEAQLAFVKGVPPFEFIAASTKVDNGWTILKPDSIGSGSPGRWEITRPNTFDYDSSWDEAWVDDYVIGETGGAVDHSASTGTDMATVIQAQIDYLSDLVKQDELWVEATDISFTAPDKINSAASEFGVFSAGDIIGTFGSDNNDHTAIIDTVTAAQIVVKSDYPGRPLVTDSAGPTVRITRQRADQMTGRRQFVRLIIPNQAKIGKTIYVKSGVEISTTEVLYSHLEALADPNSTYFPAFIFMAGSHIDQFKMWGRGNGGITLGTERILNDMKIGNIRLFNIGQVYVSEDFHHYGVRYQGFNFEYNHMQVDGGIIGFDYNACSDVRGIAALSVTASTSFRITSGCEQLDLGVCVADSPNFLGAQIDSSGNLKVLFRMFFNEDAFPTGDAFESGYAAKVGIFSTADPVANCDLTFQIANTHKRVGGGNSVGVLFGAIEDSSTVIILANRSLHTTQTLHTEYVAEAHSTYTSQSPNLQVTNDVRIHGSGEVFGISNDLDDMWKGTRPGGTGYIRETEGQTTYQGVVVGGGGGGGSQISASYRMDAPGTDGAETGASIGWHRIAKAESNFGEGSFEITFAHKRTAPTSDTRLKHCWAGIPDSGVTLGIAAAFTDETTAAIIKVWKIVTETLINGAHSINATSFTVDSSTGFTVGEKVIFRDGYRYAELIIDTVPNGTTITTTTTIWFALKDNADVYEKPTSSIAATTTTRYDGNRRLIQDFTTSITTDTRYLYTVFPDGTTEYPNFLGFVKTTPPVTQTFNFWLSGCGAYVPTSTPYHIAMERPDFGIHTGDLAYLDPWEDPSANGTGLHGLEVGRFMYDQVLSTPAYKTLMGFCATSYMYDDHDVGKNNGNKTDPSNVWAKQLFRENCPCVPETGTRTTTTGSPYYSFVWGRCRFIITDCRTERDNYEDTDSASKVILSDTQADWLIAEMNLAIVNNQIIFWQHGYPFIDDDLSDEAWGRYTFHRDELVDRFAGVHATKTNCTVDVTNSLILIAGDTHNLHYHTGVLYGDIASKSFPSIHCGSIHSGGSTGGGIGGVWTAGGDDANASSGQFGIITVEDNVAGVTVDVTFTPYRADTSSPYSNLVNFVGDGLGGGWAGDFAPKTFTLNVL